MVPGVACFFPLTSEKVESGDTSVKYLQHDGMNNGRNRTDSVQRGICQNEWCRFNEQLINIWYSHCWQVSGDMPSLLNTSNFAIHVE